MKKIKKKSFFVKLIENNTGVSSKNFFLVAVTIVGCLTILIFDAAILIEVIMTSTISTDLMGMAACFTAIASGFIGAGFAKVRGDKNEYLNHQQQQNNEDEENTAC